MSAVQPTANALYYGDCLEWMARWDDQTVDLVYLDPPFNSQTNYNVLFGKTVGGAQYRAFTDTWHWDADAAERFDAYCSAIARPAHAAIVGLHSILGPSGMMSYLTYMAERLEHCHRLLKPTGSLYLHCDPTASHYLKALLDAVFGHRSFRNEIVWKRTAAHGRAKRWGPIHDTVLFYSKSDRYTWNRIFQPYDQSYIDNFFRHTDERGRYRVGNMTGPGIRDGSSGQPWRGIDPTVSGRHWEVPPDRILPRDFVHPPGYASMNVQERLDVLDEAGLIYWPPRGSVPQPKQYLDVSPGNPIQDIVLDISPALGREGMGYATQKPRALLERIITASSNPGDLVLDPFCGCGTTIAAARELKRAWVGVDISPFAIDLIRERLQDPSIPAYGIPYDLAGASKLAAEHPFAFETWAVTRLNGFVPNTKQVADGGVDGRGTVWEQPDADVTRLALAQVKGGSFNLGQLRDFNHVVRRDRAALGCYLTVDRVDTHAARTEIAGMDTIRVGGMAYPRMQRWSMADYFDRLPPVLPLMADPYTGKPMQMRLI